jgi:hypothetical protein
VVALTVEKEDGDAWVRNRLGNDEIRCSWWLNGGDGFQGVSSECFGVGGACGRKGSKGENVAVTYKASDGWRRKGKGVRSVLPCGGREEKGGGGGGLVGDAIQARRPHATWRHPGDGGCDGACGSRGIQRARGLTGGP